MKLFSNLEECKAIIKTFLEDLSVENRERMKTAFTLSDTFVEREAIWLITNTFRDCLWDIDEAVRIGFTSWLKENISDRRNAMIYHGMIK